MCFLFVFILLFRVFSEDMSVDIEIKAGTLNLILSKGANRVNELLDFASRENEKRSYLFVSKVLGKHIPVKPYVMRSLYEELARLCGATGTSFVVGMAETATGLGAGVADSLSRLDNQGTVVYQHTTRHTIDADTWMTLDESHSHAVDHILYRPYDDCFQHIQAAKRLILVDDEISTGRTLLLLAEKLLSKLSEVKELVIVSIVSWVDAEKRDRFKSLPVKIRFVNLIEGEFEFEANNDFSPSLPVNVDKGICKDSSRPDLGRRAMLLPYNQPLDIPCPPDGSKCIVIGTGEHLFLPFLIAEQMELQGDDVLFQSTTRSPVVEGDAIKRKITFSDEGKDVVSFIYNLPCDRTAHIICENEQTYNKNGLVRFISNKV